MPKNRESSPRPTSLSDVRQFLLAGDSRDDRRTREQYEPKNFFPPERELAAPSTPRSNRFDR